MTTKIEIETGEYNERRYSKPWIAVVDFGQNPRGEYSWGAWIGNHGSKGLLVITAGENDIIARGQKDFRGNNTWSKYYQIRDGKPVQLNDKAEAYKAYTSTHQ